MPGEDAKIMHNYYKNIFAANLKKKFYYLLFRDPDYKPPKKTTKFVKGC